MSARRESLLDFLRAHRLETHADTLRENSIDLDVLPLLTDDDFKEMGLPLGDRRRLMSAANALASDNAPGSGRATEAPSPERRQLTVLFCDMVGSTQLSSRLDPEDLGEVMRTFTDRASAAMTLMGGHIANVLGDGLLVYFGYPSASEDDVSRAVIAALNCLHDVANSPIVISTGERINVQVRIGVHTGLVVAGNVGGTLSLGESSIVGEAPNIAARLQAAAEPNQILVSRQTRALAGDRFEFVEYEPRSMKGLATPVTPFAVVREITSKTRFEWHSGGNLTPMVGRTREAEALYGHWQAAKSGVAQTVMLSGQAGIGKSRLSSGLVDTIAAERKLVLKYQCSPHHTSTPLFPVIMGLNQTLEQMSAADRLGSLSRLFERGKSESEKRLALIASLLSIDGDGELESLDMSPRQQMEETLLALVEHALMLSRRRPLLILFEDVHWADPTTLDLIRLLVTRATDDRVMIIITFRTDLAQYPLTMEGANFYQLGRLSDCDSRKLVEKSVSPHKISEAAVDAIVERAGGVPLFAEEISKSVVEKLESGDWEEAGAAGAHDMVPGSLVDSLSARLDALPNSKHLAQVAAAIGREIPQDLLKRVAAYSPEHFNSALAELVNARLIETFPYKTTDRLIFSHALIQDVAYQLLLKKDRSAIHARIAAVLERDYPEMVEDLPEAIARHCEAANLTEKAIHYNFAAGTKAIRRSANVEALGHLKRGLRLIAEGTDIDRQAALELELEIQSAIGTPLIGVEGYTSKATVTAFERARKIAELLDDNQKRFRALYGLWGHRWMAGHLDLSIDLATEMLAIAEDEESIEYTILANRCMGSSHWVSGDIGKTRSHLSRVAALTEEMDTSELAEKYAVCPFVVSQVLGGYVEWLDGHQDRAIRMVNAGLQRAGLMNHAYSLALSHSILAGLNWLSGDFEQMQANTDALRKIAEDRRFPYWLAYADTLQGAILAKTGQCADGVARIRSAIAAYDMMGVYLHRTMQLLLLSDAEMRSGNTAEARDLLDNAIEMGNQTGERQLFGLIERQKSRLDEEKAGRTALDCRL